MIHLFKEQDGSYQVWTDCERDHYKSGRCLGSGQTEHAALNLAALELGDDSREMGKLWQNPVAIPSPD